MVRISSRTLTYLCVLLGVSVMTTTMTYRRVLAMQHILERSHPLAHRRRQLRLSRLDTNLRYLSFTNIDYGVLDPDGLIETYPDRLDSAGVSITLPTKYGDLAAACTQSIVGDTRPHVITIEYDELCPSYRILLRRLRERFPSAVLVLIELVNSSCFIDTLTNQSVADLIEGQQEGANQDARSVLETKTLNGARFQIRKTSESDRISEQVIRDDPMIVQYSLADQYHPDDLPGFLDLFTPDLKTLSHEGHLQISLDIRNIVEEVVPRIPDAQIMGTWGSGDDCHIWYATGNYNLESSGQQVELPLIASSAYLFSGAHKHALEFVKDKATNKITVHNPFPEDRLLSLTYLTDRNSLRYPKTRVFLNNQATVVLLPFHDQQRHRHVARTTGVGFVPPGTSTVRLEPLQGTKLPFRLLGASLLADEAQGLESMEFAFESDSLVASDDDLVESPGILSTLLQ